MTLRRVLLVDDCLDNHELIREALDGEFEVFGLSDPMRFSDAVEVAQPDLVILDLLMPRRSGFDILEEMNRKKKQADHLDLPVIVLSAKRSVENHKRAYALGAVLYLNKPFEPDRLLRNIKMLVENAKLPAPEAKQFKVSEVDRQLELRRSFQNSQLTNEMEARKKTSKVNSPTTTKKGPAKPGDEEEDEEEQQPRWVD